MAAAKMAAAKLISRAPPHSMPGVTYRRSLWLLIALTASAAACARTPSTPDRPVVALVMKSLANEFFRTMEDGARTHQAAHPHAYELLATGIKDEQDVARQIEIVEQMIARNVQAIVLAPADSRALVAVAQRAIAAGIVVVNIDNRFDAAVLAERKVTIPFVGPDNRKGARLVGEAIARRLKRGDPIAIVEGAPNAFNGTQRKLGFEDAAHGAGLTIVRSQTAHWEAARANQVVSAIVSEHPDVKAVLCANDSMALGAVAALKAAGRSGQVLVGGFDNISAVQQLVRDGQIVATADQHGDQLAVYGIEHALQMLRDKTVRPADRETPVDLITAETLR
jgi:ribose transport system substrate-binding protein